MTEEERSYLNHLTSKGRASSRKIKRAQILLLGDEKRKDKDITQALHLARITVFRIEKKFVNQGLEWALRNKPGSTRETMIGNKISSLSLRRAAGLRKGERFRPVIADETASNA